MCFAFLASGDCEQPAKAKMSVRPTAIMLIEWRVPIVQTSCQTYSIKTLYNATLRSPWQCHGSRGSEAGLLVISCGGAEAGIVEKRVAHLTYTSLRAGR